MVSSHSKLQALGVDREQLCATALTAFFNISKAWELSSEEEQVLLGKHPRSTYFKWKKQRSGLLSNDTLERISYLMGIYKSLRILLPDEQAADSWVRKPNNAPLFAGKSALELMLKGHVSDLSDVRRYLDAQRG